MLDGTGKSVKLFSRKSASVYCSFTFLENDFAKPFVSFHELSSPDFVIHQTLSWSSSDNKSREDSELRQDDEFDEVLVEE